MIARRDRISKQRFIKRMQGMEDSISIGIRKQLTASVAMATLFYALVPAKTMLRQGCALPVAEGVDLWVLRGHIAE